MSATNIYVCLLAFLVYLLVPSFSAPAVTEETFYDQRQNGSENLRIHVNGIYIIDAPAEVLLALASLSDDSATQQQLMELISGSLASSTAKPTTTAGTTASTTSELPETSPSSTAAATVEELTSTITTATTPEKPVLSESTKPPKKTKGRLRLSSLLMPFIRRL
ncbi:hypothetical protein L9F63_014600 [Diploptera punctata]|uniref:Uncharacterized protein n=1 Tax=Diploptera punctata TaxID=6984 RepID=A0AAD8A7M3_DIPPU|nr:hypothetical protein L9F63_014600 [Diploptera punctata]